MRRRRRKKMSFNALIIVFVVSTFTLSVGYSLLYETLTVSGTGNLIVEQDDNQTTSEYLRFTYTTNGWYSEGKYFYQIDGVLENLSDYTIEDWKVVLHLPGEFEVQGSWNGTVEKSGQTLTITPAAYNMTIEPKTSITIGIQIVYDLDVLEFDEIKLYGDAIGVGSGDDSDSGNDTGSGDDSGSSDDTGSGDDSDSGNDTGLGDDSDSGNDTGSGDDSGSSGESDSITNNLNVSMTLRSEWQSGDNYAVQYDVIVTNISDVTIENWEFEIELPEDISVSQIWGANYINVDGILKISGVDYTASLEPGASANIVVQFESPYAGYVPKVIQETNINTETSDSELTDETTTDNEIVSETDSGSSTYVLQRDETITNNLTVTTELTSEWQSGDNYLSQHKFTVTNSTNETIENWHISIELPEDVKFSQIWEGNYINADGILKISGVTYNSTLQPGASAEILVQFESPYAGYVPEIM